jgi:signal transduction histidine kinase
MPDRDEGHGFRRGTGFRPGGGFRPPWWPEGEPFPPGDSGPWRARRRRFARRVGLALAVFFALTFASSALAVAMLSGALGLGRHRGLVFVTGILGLGLLFGGFVAFGRAVRRAAGPLSDVMDAADRVAAGEYDARVEERGPRDMRRLARSFNAMTERLRAAEEQRRNLLADVAHELRTPLTVVQGGTEGMLDGLYPADRTHLQPILDEIRVMSRLLDDLQTLSTAEAGVLRLHREVVDPGALVEDAVAAFRSQASVAGVTLGLRVEPGLPALEVDPLRVGEILSNLLTNSLRHTPPGGSVVASVELADGGRAVAFVVKDTGRGIAPDVLSHVFERFVKAADSGGAGLGLAIARSLVEAHDGQISAESAPAVGTTMRFVLPAAEP